jgi:hypothetical protein
MTTQQNADRLLIAWQASRHLPATLRAREIDEAILVAANSNATPIEALYLAQLDAVGAEMAAR